MDRLDLDAFYRVSAKVALRKAFAEEPITPATVAFLRDHAAELSLEQLSDLLQRERARNNEWTDVGPFLNRLAQLLIEASHRPSSELLMGLHDVIQLAPGTKQSWLDQDAWRVLVDATRGQESTSRWWWWLVDHSSGGKIFNALNASPPPLPRATRDFELATQRRAAPLVLPLLDNPLDDRPAAAHLFTLPMKRVLSLMLEVPDLVGRANVEAIAAARSMRPIEGDDWTPPLPDWLAPYVPGRAERCGDAEALELYAWLEQAGLSRDALFALALNRFRLYQHRLATFDVARTDPRDLQSIRHFGPQWCCILGTFLTTGTAWKSRGQQVIEACVDANRGFPPSLLEAALENATAHDGASDADHRTAILQKAHDVAGLVLVSRAKAAMNARDWERAQRLLEALVTLEPGKFLRGPVHHLRSIESVPDSLLTSIHACEHLLKGGGRAPNEGDFLDAFNVLGGMP